MPKSGQLLMDDQTGNSIEFLATSADTNGEYVLIRIFQKSKGPMIDDHIHPVQQETFEVLSGTLTYMVGGESRDLTQGDEIILPKNVAHNHYNDKDEPVLYTQKIEPAYDIDLFLENYMGLIKDGKVNQGKLPFLQAMVTLRYLDSPAYLASMPRFVQNLLASSIAPVARVLGYRAIYKKYTGYEK